MIAASIAASIAGASAAATLGPLTAQSVRDEPLRAVVRIDESVAASLPALRIAPPALYERLGYPRDPALAGAAVTVSAEPDGTSFARVSTADPVTADEIVLLIEIEGTSHRRVYRLRLGSAEPAHRVNVRGTEPVARPAGSAGGGVPQERSGSPGAAGTGVRQTGDVSATTGSRQDPAGGESARGSAAIGGEAASGGEVAFGGTVAGRGEDAEGGARGRAGASDGAMAAGVGPAAPIVPQGRPDALEVPPGADLVSIARALRPPGATVEQSAVALLRANRAVLAGNPARPRAGTVLAVPGEATVLALDPALAREAFAALTTSTVPVTQATPARPVTPARPAEPANPVVLATPRAPIAPAPAATSGPRPPADAMGSPAAVQDVRIAATLERLRALERRVQVLRAGVDSSSLRQDALEREIRGAAAPPAPVSGSRRTP
jgi:pilus assembly protein FimV